ncbi:S41 family peptidase [Streptomyces sp. H27-D2]|uniref:S41 family peptidase n=1 Tax=Streptomyces sp. H27-D2 TaxID=3046304 RepID=UPI002DBC94AD|nr:S41 family peptidase [Streptomyces sp. H27-D2]MEC4015066.1 S41 family peptidase [Streptomyces sp. H27-D2]
MSGPRLFVRPRRTRRGAALTLVFASVLATGAAANSWAEYRQDGQGGRKEVRIPARAVAGSAELEAAAVAAMEDGKSASEAAEDVVSRSGDRWGAVYSAREYEGFQQTLDGEYVGVGLWVRRTEGGLIEVARVQPGSPAAKAGLHADDRLRSIDDKRVTGRPVTEVTAGLRGDAPAGDSAGAAAGTPVVLGLQRGDRKWTRTLQRARLAKETVTVDRAGASSGTARSGARPTRIKVTAFTKGSGEQVRRAVRAAPRAGGLLLDLRGNSGGLVTEAVTAASAFLDGGLVATYDVRGDQRALYAKPGGDTRTPLVVLVDGGTMSAAELLTGALQDRGRTVVVGSRTFGKGSVQMPSELPDGSVAELTVGHYRTPAGRGVDTRGIVPDLAVSGDARSTEKKARTVLSGLGGGV